MDLFKKPNGPVPMEIGSIQPGKLTKKIDWIVRIKDLCIQCCKQRPFAKKTAQM